MWIACRKEAPRSSAQSAAVVSDEVAWSQARVAASIPQMKSQLAMGHPCRTPLYSEKSTLSSFKKSD